MALHGGLRFRRVTGADRLGVILERHLGVNQHLPALGQVYHGVGLEETTVLVVERRLGVKFLSGPQAGGFQHSRKHQFAPLSLKLVFAAQGLAQVDGVVAQLLVQAAELVQLLLQRAAFPAFLAVQGFQPLAEAADLLVQRLQQQVQRALVFSAQAFVLLVQNAVGCCLKMRFYLSPGFGQKGIPLGQLLPQTGAGALQGGVVHIQFPAFPGQRPAFLCEPRHFVPVFLGLFLQPLQPALQHESFVPALLAYEQAEQEGDKQSAAQAQSQGKGFKRRTEPGKQGCRGQGVSFWAGGHAGSGSRPAVPTPARSRTN